MQSFSDNAGNVWHVVINVSGVKRVRSMLGVDIPSLIDDQGSERLAKLLGDPVSLVDVIYVLCRDQMDAKGVTDEKFGNAMAGDSLQGATDAFLAAFSDFFQDPRTRAGIKKLIATSQRAADLNLSQMATKLETFDVEREARKLIGLSGSARESSGSTPDPSPSAS